MAIDRATADSILNPYRNMYQEVQDKRDVGESFHKMKEILNRMEELALLEDDVVQFTTKLTTEDLFIQFSTAYAEVLSAASKDEYSGVDGDHILLKKTLKAYQDSINSLEGDPHFDKQSAPIKELIELGESGVSYPVFLRIAEEKGLNRVLEGDMVVREGILADIEFARFMHLPLEVEKQEKILKVHDQLASISPFEVVDAFNFGLERQKIEWEYLPAINKWQIVIRVWEKMLENVYDWLDSYTSFAPHDDRWIDMRGQIHTKRNIKRTQECNPGILKAREQVLQDYFHMEWRDIFTHRTFITEYQANRIWYSDETLELIKRAYLYCKPFESPDNELIQEAENIYREKRFKRPDAFQISDEDKKRFIALFGEGKWNEMFHK